MKNLTLENIVKTFSLDMYMYSVLQGHKPRVGKWIRQRNNWTKEEFKHYRTLYFNWLETGHIHTENLAAKILQKKREAAKLEPVELPAEDIKQLLKQENEQPWARYLEDALRDA